MKITKFKTLLLDISLSICSFNPLCVWGVGNDPVVGWSSFEDDLGAPHFKEPPTCTSRTDHQIYQNSRWA
jgi:hypothetical protein